jgi:hypothetical protein
MIASGEPDYSLPESSLTALEICEAAYLRIQIASNRRSGSRRSSNARKGPACDLRDTMLARKEI